MALNLLNQTILGVDNIEAAPYSVNVAEFFTAYTAPLTYSPVDFTTIGNADHKHIPPPYQPRNHQTSSDAIDAWIDATLYGLKSSLKSQGYNRRVYGFVAHALATNSRKIVSDDINRIWTQADQKTILSVNLKSLYVFAALTGSVIFVSLCMIIDGFRRIQRHPDKIGVFPVSQIMFEAGLGKELTAVLVDIHLATDGEIITRLSNLRVKVVADKPQFNIQ